MAVEKKLYRSRDVVIGGVCAGIAEYFNIDPIIVRIAAVVLTVASAGISAIAYIALWIVLPQKPDTATPYDVSPEEVRSDIYERVIVNNDGDSPGAAGNAGYQPYQGIGSIPPEPPRGEAARYSNYYQVTEPAPGIPPAAQEPSTQPTQPTQPMPTPNPPQPVQPPAPAPNTPPPSNQSPTERSSVKAALFIGFTLLFLGVAALLGNLIEGAYWWQFWPLIFVITGIGQMVIPGKPGRRMNHFVEGMMTCMFGLFALPISLDIVSISSLGPIFSNLWPILLIMAGFFILGDALKAPIFTLFAGFFFVAFCVIGLAWFSIPGSTDWIGITLPNGAYYSIAVGSLL